MSTVENEKNRDLNMYVVVINQSSSSHTWMIGGMCVRSDGGEEKGPGVDKRAEPGIEFSDL